jgi:hypothetical protein
LIDPLIDPLIDAPQAIKRCMLQALIKHCMVINDRKANAKYTPIEGINECMRL